MKTFITAMFLLGSISICLSGDPQYPVSEIPEELKQDVNVIVRNDFTSYQIHEKSRASLRVHFAATILNNQGNEYAKLTLWYSKLKKISSIRGAVYDASGKVVKRLKPTEIYDQAMYDGFTLYSDTRLKYVNLSQSIYPYTVEFEYEIEYKYLYSIDGTSLTAPRQSVQQATYQLIYPKHLKPRYKTFNIDQQPSQEVRPDGSETLTWKFQNLKPYQPEPLSPHSGELIPRIEAAPSSFEYEGYAGDMTSWESYGKWIALLNKGRDALPAESVQKVKALTQHLSSTEEKVKTLYEYLQSKTRYVNISLGIGGLQPFEASVVDEKGYGDCKALSNYMVAMLREAGIKAYYATVMAGEDEQNVVIEFPSHQANHAIVAVPNGSDTLWLECTSQSSPFAYQGRFTGDRKAMIITEEGGKLVHTTRYPADVNVQSRKAEVFVNASGNGKAKVSTTYSGLQYENGGLHRVLNDRYDAQREWILENTKLPTFDLNSFSIKSVKDRIPSAIVNMDLTLDRFASVSGKRMFLTPNLMNRSVFIPEKLAERKTDVVNRIGWVDYDTIQYHLPENIYPEFLPGPVKINSRFGEYEASYAIEQGAIIYYRKMKLRQGRFAPETYGELIEFFRSVNKADNAKLVFLTKT